jgi:hypothetical protein
MPAPKRRHPPRQSRRKGISSPYFDLGACPRQPTMLPPMPARNIVSAISADVARRGGIPGWTFGAHSRRDQGGRGADARLGWQPIALSSGHLGCRLSARQQVIDRTRGFVYFCDLVIVLCGSRDSAVAANPDLLRAWTRATIFFLHRGLPPLAPASQACHM